VGRRACLLALLAGAHAVPPDRRSRDGSRFPAYLSGVSSTSQPPPAADARPDLAPLNEAQLLCREWFEAHGTAVYNYFRFHVPLADVAEDLTAETFLKVVRAAERFDPGRGSAKAWILTTARNVLTDWRRRARLRQYVSIGTMHDLVHEAPSPEERLLREEEVGQLLDAVATLDPADREMIGLRYGSGLATSEMAELLGISEGNVRTRLWRVLGRLRKALPR
jgi:RNA polymerase sigma-70 factor, ECF subfamily